MSRRHQIRMTEDELRSFVASQRVVTCASLGPGGRPHLVPLWYVPDGAALVCWTYAASQKAKNLERVPQATLQIETGTVYEELRGVMMECDAELVRDVGAIEEIGRALMLRYASPDTRSAEVLAELREFIARQAAKRIGVRFIPTRTVSWDHRKLGGVY